MTENISTAEKFIAGNKAIISQDTVEDVIEFLYDLKAEGICYKQFGQVNRTLQLNGFCFTVGKKGGSPGH
jgi:hypothetical protein